MSEFIPTTEPPKQPEKKEDKNSILKAFQSPLSTISNVGQFLSHPLILSIIIFVLLITIYLGGGGILSFILTIALIVYLTFIIVQLITNYQVTTNLKSLFSENPQLDIQLSKGSELDKDKKSNMLK